MDEAICFYVYNNSVVPAISLTIYLAGFPHNQ